MQPIYATNLLFYLLLLLLFQYIQIDKRMTLIQSNVRNYLCDILLKCHEKKTTIYYWVLNMSVLFIFTMTVGIILFVCYKQKPTDQELRQKMIRDQQYILQQIRFFKDQSASMSNITDLPLLYRDDIRNDNQSIMGYL